MKEIPEYFEQAKELLESDIDTYGKGHIMVIALMLELKDLGTAIDNGGRGTVSPNVTTLTATKAQE